MKFAIDTLWGEANVVVLFTACVLTWQESTMTVGLSVMELIDGVLPDPSHDKAYQKWMRMRFNVSSGRLLLKAISSWFITLVHLESYERRYNQWREDKKSGTSTGKSYDSKCVCLYVVRLRNVSCLPSLSGVSSKPYIRNVLIKIKIQE